MLNLIYCVFKKSLEGDETMSNPTSFLNIALEKGQGVFRLFPNWVPRAFCTPGKRLKLHPDDYFSFGVHRGGIDERWFASTVRADNGPETLPDEGLSYIYIEDGPQVEKILLLLKDAIELMGKDILGKRDNGKVWRLDYVC